MIKVDNILDIPDINDYKDLDFKFRGFLKSDNVQFYTAPLTDEVELTLEVISEEDFISTFKIDDIVSQHNITWFQLAHVLGDEVLKSYYYSTDPVTIND